ncbi:MAG: threonine--tRNA ligase [Candidatus Omnitrophica bacterium]|nr:threonine--tRNA ligase [Candidatus Omnitrophota bacterium]
MADQSDLKIYWHTSAHILAQAVKRLFPEVKLGIGPAIEKGFYYDFFRQEPFTPEDLTRIEAEMRRITEENLPVIRQEIPKEEAKEILKDEPFKQEILEEIPEDLVIFYQQGEFRDLCQGPHLANTGQVRHFKLLSVAASYWKGDEKRESLQRIYGISFPEKKSLDEYLVFLEEARERDHRTLGQKLNLFSLHPEYGSGLVFWHPKGAAVRKVIEDFWRTVHLENGYQLLYTPHIADLTLWDCSGHTSFYRENMFPPMELDSGQKLQLKPMNCPFHILVYKNSRRSYRELPLRWAELGTVYRLEKQGVLHGLLRVRGFTQDDAHIFCTPEQLEEEIVGVIKLVCYFLSSFGFKDYRIFLSTRPEIYVGTRENWERATKALEEALKKQGLAYEIDPGAGVFYGPKIDIKIRDCLGREWQCSTVQVDFNIPERFNLTYVNQAGKEQAPIMIHRAILGSLERFFGVLIEHYKGNMPFWLAPVQCRVLPIADRHLPYARAIQEALKKEFRVEVDDRNEKINRKIRDAEEEKIPLMLIVGDREQKQKLVSVRWHGEGRQGSLPVDQLRELLEKKLACHE